ncbi:hypothetical protein E2C01_079656 [Portunus trituberculatus]|uniref:Uncharacterized protein n=1 Tax=Portunus trituberculatus TaxID=210409 RepID=A0A5B7IXK4_PORTR|nr:hypothetical protein [Portunus trituberculatus]
MRSVTNDGIVANVITRFTVMPLDPQQSFILPFPFTLKPWYCMGCFMSLEEYYHEIDNPAQLLHSIRLLPFSLNP